MAKQAGKFAPVFDLQDPQTASILGVGPNLAGFGSAANFGTGTPQTFQELQSLAPFDFQEDVVVTGRRPFAFGSPLKSVTFPFTHRDIGDVAFANCALLKALRIRKSLGNLPC